MTGSLQLPGRHQINPQDILQNHSTAEYVAVFVTYFKELDQSPQNPKLPHSPENVTQPLAETPKSKLKVYINLHNQKPLKENHEMFTWEDGGDRFCNKNAPKRLHKIPKKHLQRKRDFHILK